MPLSREQHKALRVRCHEQNGFWPAFGRKYGKVYKGLTHKVFGIGVAVPDHVAIQFFRFILESDRPFNDLLAETMYSAPARHPDKFAEISLRQMVVTRSAMKDSAPPTSPKQQQQDLINEFTHRNEVRRFSDKNFYRSREWREMRLAVLTANRACKLCGASPLTGAVLHIDHIKPRSLWPELSLEMSNLQVLCSVCNIAKSNIIDGKY